MKNSSVFNLIKGMDTSEKRHFNLFSKRHILGSLNKYTLLFNSMNGMDTENDSELIQILQKNEYDATFLAADKNYLYNQILRSFQTFHRKKTTTIHLTELLTTIEILYEKGLYDLCEKETQKAKKIALEIENYSFLLEIINWERKTIGYTQGFQKAYEVNSTIKNYLALLSNQIEYTDLYYESLELRFKDFKARRLDNIEMFESLLKNPLLQDENLAVTLLSKIRFHLVYSNYYYIKNESKSEYYHLDYLIKLMEDSSYYIKENPFDYLYITYYMIELMIKKMPNEVPSALEKLKEFPARFDISKRKVSTQVQAFAYIAELDWLKEQNKYSEGYQMINEVKFFMSKNNDNIEPAWHIKFYFLFGSFCIATGNYKKALEFLNHLFNNYKENQRADYYNYSKLLVILVHFKLNNFGLIEYIFKNTFLYYKKKNKLFKIEKVVLDFIKEISANQSQLRINQKIKNLEQQLLELRGENFEKPAFELFDIGLWVKSIIENKTMEQLANPSQTV